MTKKNHILVTIFTLLICGGYLITQREELKILYRVGLLDLVKLSAAMFLYFIVLGYTFLLNVRLMKVNLSFMEMTGLSFITNFSNYLGPTSPGAVLKAIYLKSKRGMSYAKFMPIFFVNNFLGFVVTGFVGMILYSLILQQNIEMPRFWFWCSLGMMIAALVPFFYSIPLPKVQGKLTEVLYEVSKGFNEIRDQRRGLLFICASYVLQIIVRSTVYHFSFIALDVQLPLTAILALSVYTSLFEFNITPNNLGSQEVLGGLILVAFGYSFHTGVIGSALMRATHLIVLGIFTPVFTHRLMDKKDFKNES